MILTTLTCSKEVFSLSLDKSILHNKEHRRPYYGSKAIDKSCRNHGGCGICEGNRQYKNIKRFQSLIDKMKELEV